MEGREQDPFWPVVRVPCQSETFFATDASAVRREDTHRAGDPEDSEPAAGFPKNTKSGSLFLASSDSFSLPRLLVTGANPSRAATGVPESPESAFARLTSTLSLSRGPEGGFHAVLQGGTSQSTSGTRLRTSFSQASGGRKISDIFLLPSHRNIIGVRDFDGFGEFDGLRLYRWKPGTNAPRSCTSRAR